MPIVLTLAALAAAGWLGFMAAAGARFGLLVLAASAATALFAFFSPRLSLGLLVFSMLLSPEMGLGAVSSSRSLVVRYDDLFILIIFMSWFARTAIFKQKPFITATPVQAPVLLYTALCVVSTALGVMRGDVNWKMASLYVLKYVEYFILFFMTVNIVESEGEVKKYLRYGFVVAVLVTVYAYYYYFASGDAARASAPFEAPVGDPKQSEPASLGGYYLLVFGALLGLISETGGAVSRPALALLVFAFPAFLFTYSRASYIGFAAMVPALFFFTRKRKLFLAGLLAAGTLAVLMVPAVKSKVVGRVMMTWRGTYATQAFNAGVAGQIKLEDSAAARVYSLRRAVHEQLPKHPVLGWGVTGVGLGDTQYALVLGELGILGAALFLWMLYRLFYTANMVFRASGDAVIRGLSLGFMISLIALLFQAVGVNTFIIVRIMEPFWFLAALLSVMYLRLTKAAPAGGSPGGGPPGRSAWNG